MYKHHEETIHNITEKLKKRDDVLAVMVSGSIAHGFETENSDVDLLILISDEDYRKRAKNRRLQYYEKESCTYEAGYIDGKYVCLDFMKQVAERGSEPARFAFEGCIVTYSKVDGLEELLRQIVRYPVEKKGENIKRFYAQFEAWKWYCEEALKHQNCYLLTHSAANFVLFAGRLILAHNEVLYPYHKWFMRVLSGAREKPSNLMEYIDSLLKQPSRENVLRLYHSVKEFRQWEKDGEDWPILFMEDSEWNWMNGNPPVSDL